LCRSNDVVRKQGSVPENVGNSTSRKRSLIKQERRPASSVPMSRTRVKPEFEKGRFVKGRVDVTG